MQDAATILTGLKVSYQDWPSEYLEGISEGPLHALSESLNLPDFF